MVRGVRFESESSAFSASEIFTDRLLILRSRLHVHRPLKRSIMRLRERRDRRRVAFQSVYKRGRMERGRRGRAPIRFDVVGARWYGKLIWLPVWIDLNFKFQRLIWQKPSDRSACRPLLDYERVCRGAGLIEKWPDGSRRSISRRGANEIFSRRSFPCTRVPFRLAGPR